MNKDNRKEDKVGLERLNNQNDLMKIIVYNNYNNIIVQFQDKYKAEIHTTYNHFLSGGVKNPYRPSIYNVGIVGNKYIKYKNYKSAKEYVTWTDMLRRCFSENFKRKNPTYRDVICCKEWLLYENFYEWLHSQENFDKWLKGDKWTIDKDVLIKGNKIYSPQTCFLVSNNVNCLIVKCNAVRGGLPIGVTYNNINKKYIARVSKYRDGKEVREYIGCYNTPEEAFQAYKKAKESYIKQVAQEEYNKGNITKRCYEAMMKYEVEITD